MHDTLAVDLYFLQNILKLSSFVLRLKDAPSLAAKLYLTILSGKLEGRKTNLL